MLFEVATTISGEAEQEIGEELGDAKIAVLPASATQSILMGTPESIA